MQQENKRAWYHTQDLGCGQQDATNSFRLTSHCQLSVVTEVAHLRKLGYRLEWMVTLYTEGQADHTLTTLGMHALLLER